MTMQWTDNQHPVNHVGLMGPSTGPSSPSRPRCQRSMATLQLAPQRRNSASATTALWNTGF